MTDGAVTVAYVAAGGVDDASGVLHALPRILLEA